MEPPDNVLAGITVEPLSAEKRNQLNLTEQVKGVVVAKSEHLGVRQKLQESKREI